MITPLLDTVSSRRKATVVHILRVAEENSCPSGEPNRHYVCLHMDHTPALTPFICPSDSKSSASTIRSSTIRVLKKEQMLLAVCEQIHSVLLIVSQYLEGAGRHPVFLDLLTVQLEAMSTTYRVYDSDGGRTEDDEKGQHGTNKRRESLFYLHSSDLLREFRVEQHRVLVLRLLVTLDEYLLHLQKNAQSIISGIQRGNEDGRCYRSPQ